MFKNIILGLTLTLSTISFYANAGLFSDDEVIEMEVEEDYVCNDYGFCQVKYIYSILPLVDGLTVTNVIANDGRCKATAKRYFNRKLSKDGYAEFSVYSDESGKKCRPRAVVVNTNKGDWEFTF